MGKRKASPGVEVVPTERVVIAPVNIKRAVFSITGTSPLVLHRFGEKARNQIKDKQTKGSTADKGSGPRKPKDFDACYKEATYTTAARNGKYGIPAIAFKASLVAACRLCGFKMTWAKQALYVEAQAYDYRDHTPLILITAGKPHRFETYVNLKRGGTDIRIRPMWEPGWKATVTIRYDADQFTTEDVANLLNRAGFQVGLCEGRPASKASSGQDWGTFAIEKERSK